MNNNKKTLYIVGAVIVAIALFFAGVQTGKAMAFKGRGGMMGGQFTRGQMGQFGGQAGAGQNRFGGARGINGGFIMGEVLSKDATGITVKLQDGGSRVVITSTSTAVMKSTTGTMNDVVVGNSVTVMGSQNADGSVTAQSIQIRPAGAPLGGPGMGRGMQVGQ